MQKHREQFSELTDIQESFLECPSDFGLWGQPTEKGVIPCLAYRFGYYANNIFQLDCSKKIFAEIGGGWGLLGHLLLKKEKMCYICIDLPSMLMCAAYFLMRLGYNVICFGEYDDLNQAINSHDVVAIPPCEAKKIDKANIFFNANSFPEMPYETIQYYIQIINDVCTDYFYYDNLTKSDFPAYGETRLQDICDEHLTNFNLEMKRLTPIHTDRPWIGNPKQELRDYEERLYKRCIK
jgi:hypothetical protein